MSDESPRDGNRPDGRPSRLFFDDLPDEPDGRSDQNHDHDRDRPRPVVTTPAASARRRQEIEESLVDTGPMEPIREPIAEPAAAGRQLYFDDIEDTEAVPAAETEPDEESATRKARPSMLAGATALGRRRGRHLPIGAVLAVLGVLVLVAVIASIGGRSGGNGDGKKALADSTSVVKHSPHQPTHSVAAPPAGQGVEHSQHTGNAPSPKPTIHAPDSPSKSAAPPTTVLMKQPLTVLNNTTIHGLAEQAASTFSSRGWNVGGVGNYTGQISSTTVYYDSGNTTQQQAAAALAGQFAGVMQAAPRFDGLPGSGLTVVLAPNWSA